MRWVLDFFFFFFFFPKIFFEKRTGFFFKLRRSTFFADLEIEKSENRQTESKTKEKMPPVPPVVTYKISSSTLPDGTRIYTLWTIVEISGQLLTTVFVEPLLPHS